MNETNKEQKGNYIVIGCYDVGDRPNAEIT